MRLAGNEDDRYIRRFLQLSYLTISSSAERAFSTERWLRDCCANGHKNVGRFFCSATRANIEDR